MTVTVCAQELLDVATRNGTAISKEEIDGILSFVQERIDSRGRAVGEADLNELIEAGRQFSQQAKINAAIEKRNRLINARAYGNIMTAIRAEPDNPSKVLSAILVGDARRGLFSVDAKQKSIGSSATKERPSGNL